MFIGEGTAFPPQIQLESYNEDDFYEGGIAYRNSHGALHTPR
jgi:hypothetical protein